MKTEESKATEKIELPDNWWYRVYLGVIVVNIIFIFALWSFSRHFSS